MSGRRSSGTHFHAYVENVPLTQAEADRDSYVGTLDSPEDVIGWLDEQMRGATGNPDIELGDERAVWLTEVRQGQQISTGLQGGPTFAVAPSADGACWCRAASLQSVQ